MKLSDFSYELPPELIAHQPLVERSASRLLVLEGETGQYHDAQFKDLLHLLRSEDLLVFNDTKVIPARLYGQKSTGGKVEVLVERILDEYRILAHIKASKSPKVGTILLLEQVLVAEMLQRAGDLFELRFDQPVLAALEQYGHMPLPPYITRADNITDKERYQTVFAKKHGAVAAPTAGLHFDEVLLQQIRQKGVEFATVTLHVGAGTFQPIRVDDIAKHIMHAEYVDVSTSVCKAINECQQRGGRVIAVGTTTVRSLESAAQRGQLEPFQGDTRLFIKPGYGFKVVDAMITNFHLPASTLLVLVSAFASREVILSSYRHAIKQNYRFFSYGDAMFITSQRNKL